MKNTLQRIAKKKIETRPKARKGVLIKAIKAIEEANDGIVTPYEVVAAARDPQSPLHNSFEWDNTEAAKRYRLMQARVLINNVQVEFMGEKRDGYMNATVEIDSVVTRGYFPIERVMSDEDVHTAVLREAVAELAYAQRKYNELKELRGVINTKRLEKVKRAVNK